MFHNGRKTIGVFLERPTSEFPNAICQGVIEKAEELGYNVAVFATYGNYANNERYFAGDQTMWKLPSYEELDGVVLALDTMWKEVSREAVLSQIKERCICPIVSVRDFVKGANNVLVDNKIAMEGIVEHFIVDHGMKKLCFMSGPKERWDANERLECFRRKMEEHNLPVGEHQCFYGNFWKTQGKEACDWFFAGEEMPEAIICANDHMALSIVSELIRRGIRVPEDICVSGYDGSQETLTFSPSVTTVTVPALDMGRRAVEIIDEKQERPNDIDDYYLPTVIEKRESCGCVNTSSKEAQELRQRLYEKGIVDENREMQFHFLSIALNECHTIDDMLDSIGVCAYNIEGLKDYCICMCEDWDATDQLRNYTDTMEVRVALKNMDGIRDVCIPYNKKDLLPAEMMGDCPQAWFFAPLHFQDRCFGYEAFQFGDAKTVGSLYQYWNIILGNKIQDISNYNHEQELIGRLEELHNRDPLTNIYNRRGLENFGNALFEQAKKEQEPIFVAVIDLDNMKHINDKFGHAEGDFAIRKLCEAISCICPEEAIQSRTGGDEFEVVIKGISVGEGDAYMRRVDAYLEQFNASKEKEYEIHASYGYSCRVPQPGDSVERLTNESDQMMYANKIVNKTRRGEQMR